MCYEISLKQDQDTLISARPCVHVVFKSVPIAPPMDLSGSRIGAQHDKGSSLHLLYASTKDADPGGDGGDTSPPIFWVSPNGPPQYFDWGSGIQMTVKSCRNV